MDGAGPGRNIGPFLLGLQKKRWRFRSAGVPGGAREGGMVRPGCGSARDAAHGFVETTVLHEVERGHPHGLVNGQKQGTGADLIALVEGDGRPPASCGWFESWLAVTDLPFAQ